MRVHRVAEGNATGAPFVVGLGTFDGVHRAHRAMLAELDRVARTRDAQVGLALIEGGAHYRSRTLTSLEHRLELLEATGIVDAVWVIPAEVHDDPHAVLEAALDAVRPVAVGLSTLLRLGRGPVVTVPELEAMCCKRSVAVVSLDDVLPGREEAAERLYSTRNISDLLDEGQVAVAARLLGRPFEMRGTVEHGDHRGRTLGVPTANLGVHSSLLIPREGVYAGVVVTEDGVAHSAAVSLGRRATFYEDGWELLEAHLLDFDGDLYGTQLRVLFAEYLRPQHRFATLEELVAQLRIDIALACEVDPAAGDQPQACEGQA